MKWTRIRIKTITSAEDIIISELYDIGLEGAQIEDNVPLTALEKEQMFVDILPECKPDDGIAYLSFFVEESSEGCESVVFEVRQKLEELRATFDIGEGSVVIDETEDIDWINNWKQYFHQFYIDDILIVPSWEEIREEDKGKMVLHIDPGTAFGTGMHETTQLCIRQLKQYIKEDTMLLDVGTGSGILSILSLMFGAKKAIGTDLDPCSLEAARENSRANAIDEEQFNILIGNIITEKEVQDLVGYQIYDVVTANILAEVLIPLTPVIKNHLKVGGIYITSGIIDNKEELVKKAMIDSGFTILDVTYQGEWVSITAQNR